MNNTYVLWAAAAVAAVIMGVWVFWGGASVPGFMASSTPVAVQNDTTTKKTTNIPPATSFKDYRSGTYTIEGKQVHLIDGMAVTAVPNSSSKVLTQFFGNETKGDLNGDKLDDVAFILMQTTGGSGTFYYAVVAVRTLNGYRGTNAIYLGDRIAPQQPSIEKGVLYVNYADRKPGEPMTAHPSVGVTKYLLLKGYTLVPR